MNSTPKNINNADDRQLSRYFRLPPFVFHCPVEYLLRHCLDDLWISRITTFAERKFSEKILCLPDKDKQKEPQVVCNGTYGLWSGVDY